MPFSTQRLPFPKLEGTWNDTGMGTLEMADVNFKKLCDMAVHMGEESAWKLLPNRRLEGTWYNNGTGTLEMIDDNFQYLCGLGVLKPYLPAGVKNPKTEGTWWNNRGKGTLEMIDENFAEVLEVLHGVPPAISSTTWQLSPVYFFEGGSAAELTDTIKYSVGCETSAKLDKSDITKVATKAEAHAEYTSEAGMDIKLPEIGGASAKQKASVGGSLEATFENVKSTMMSTTSQKEEKRERTIQLKYDFKEPLYLYQGKSTVRLADGQSVNFFGDTLVQSTRPLGMITFTF